MSHEERRSALSARANMLQHSAHRPPAQLHRVPGQPRPPRPPPAHRGPGGPGGLGPRQEHRRPGGPGGRPGPAAGGGGPGHDDSGSCAGPVGLTEGAQDVRPRPGRNSLHAALQGVQGDPGNADESGAPTLTGAGGAPLDRPRVRSAVRCRRGVATGSGLRPLPPPLLRARQGARHVPRCLPRGPHAGVLAGPGEPDPGSGGAPGLLPAGAQPEGTDAAAATGNNTVAAAPRLSAEPHAQPGEESLSDGVRVPSGCGRGSEPGVGSGAQRVPADCPVRRTSPRRTPQDAARGQQSRARSAARAAMRVRGANLRAGRACQVPAQQERPRASRQQRVGQALPPQGVHLQPVRHQLQSLAERGGRGQPAGARRLQRHQLRVPVRAVLRGQRHRAPARRAIHGLRLHEEHAGVRNVRGRRAVPGSVPRVQRALGPAEQAGPARVARAAEQREQAALRDVQEGGGGALQAGSFEYGPAEPCLWQNLDPQVEEALIQAHILGEVIRHATGLETKTFFLTPTKFVTITMATPN